MPFDFFLLKKFMKYILVILFFINAGCDGFNQSNLNSFDSAQNGLSSNVNYQLSIQSGPYEGRLVVDQIRNSSIKVLIPVGINSFVPTGDFSSAQWSLYGNTSQDENGFKTIEVNVPTNLIAQGVSTPSLTTLPNGDALDFLPSGEAQHIEFPMGSSGNARLHLYLSSPYLLGVFIQTSFDLATSNKYPVIPVNGLVPMGFFSTHPHRPPLNGGSLVFISLPR